MSYYYNLAWAIRCVREDSGFTQDQIEDALSRSSLIRDYRPGSLSLWERGGADPKSAELIALLHVCRADIYDFMDHCLAEDLHSPQP